MATPRDEPVRPVTSLPAISITPLVGSSRPAIMRNVVDLPQPEGPSRTASVPGSTSKDTLSTARASPHNLLTDLTTTLFTYFYPLAASGRGNNAQ